MQITRLLENLAARPNTHLQKVISSYFQQELSMGKQIGLIIQFITQAFQQQNEEAAKMAGGIMASLCSKDLKDHGIDTLEVIS